MDDLRGRWARLVEPTPAASDACDALLERWSEPHRHYHDVRHLVAVLGSIDVLSAESVSPDTVRLAAWFHDAVYDGRPGDDERASAALAKTMLLALGEPPDRIAEVARLVLLTQAHDPAPDDADGAVLCDADLAVLGGSPDDYAAYAAAVREDYAHVPDDEFISGRAEILRRLLAMNPLYRTVTGRRRWEQAGRRNLGTELLLLRLSR